MTDIEQQKLTDLKEYFKELGNAAIAFSGGIDSTFLAKVCHDVLGKKMIAITLVANSFPPSERREAEAFCVKENIAHLEIKYDELLISGFRENSVDRCYHCKKALFTMIKSEAAKKGFSNVCEGSNIDDQCVYRPGLKAIKEIDIKSPLAVVGLNKLEIRNISKQLGIQTWDKPSMACLATRFPYGEEITKEKLIRVGKAEQLLFELGFRQVRVRSQNNLARIELLPQDFEKFMQIKIREQVNKNLKEFGFDFVTLDIQGFRSGSFDRKL